MVKSVYLCGPMSGVKTSDSAGWRKYVAAKLAHDIIPLSPLRGKSFLKNDDIIAHTYNNVIATAEAITTRDRNDVINCDLVMANFLGAEIVSIGSVIELGWADMMRKPIVLIMEPGNIHKHPIIDTICGYKTHTLDEAINIVNIVLSQSFAKENQ